MATAPLMQGKTVIVTGASAGIGYAAALELARMGAEVILVARSAERGEQARQQIAAATGSQALHLIVADLSAQAEVKRFTDEFKARFSRLDVLLNNAGAIFNPRQVSADGLEMTFALNHMNYFLTTLLLLDVLKASAPARVVNVSSDAHRAARGINFTDLQRSKVYAAFSAYAESKLMNILFTYELARNHLAGTQVTANALHPGAVRTRFGTSTGGLTIAIFGALRPFFLSPEQGAETSIYLASSPQVQDVTAKYFNKKQAVRSSDVSYDEALQAKLWQRSLELAGGYLP